MPIQPRQQCMFLAINCASLREPQNRSIGAIARWWGAARPGQGPTHNVTSTETGMLPLRGPLNMPGGRLWREYGRLEQRQAPAGAGARPSVASLHVRPQGYVRLPYILLGINSRLPPAGSGRSRQNSYRTAGGQLRTAQDSKTAARQQKRQLTCPSRVPGPSTASAAARCVAGGGARLVRHQHRDIGRDTTPAAATCCHRTSAPVAATCSAGTGAAGPGLPLRKTCRCSCFKTLGYS